MQPQAQQMQFQIYSKIVGYFLRIISWELIRVSRTEKLAETTDLKNTIKFIKYDNF